ncbi:hypothetical protein ACX3YG_12145 [Pseudomonas wadenswilerensis]
MRHVHFDLRHLPSDAALEVRIGVQRYALRAHSDDSLAEAVSQHPTLALLSPQARSAFSHFAELPEQHFRGESTRYLHVVKPEEAGVHLAQVVAMGMLLPDAHLRTFWTNRLTRYQRPVAELRSFERHTLKRRPRVHSAKLAQLGLRALPAEQPAAVEALVHSQTLMTPLDSAGALVSHHPQLANVQPSTSALVLHDHILPDPDMDPDQYNRMQLLSSAIQGAGSDWSPVIRCTDYQGNALSAGYDLGSTFTAGQALYTYGLHDDVEAQLGPCCGGANQSASNDLRLMNKTWAPNSGTTALTRHNTAATQLGAEDVTYKWTVREQTNHHGVSVDKDSIVIDAENNFSINASNSYLRTLYAGYQLLDDSGQPIGDKRKLCSISASNTLMGIPMPTDPTALAFSLGAASSVVLYFGSLGTSAWDPDFSSQGGLLTGLWQYGVPVALMVAGKVISNTQTFNAIVNDPELVSAALAVGLPMVGAGLVAASALGDFSSMLIRLSNVALSIALQKGMEKLGQWLATQVAEGEISASFGPVGWLMRAAATAVSFEQMAVTTGEVLSSPAGITVTVGRAIDVTLTVHPDPAHGEAGNPSTAVWPAVAQKYLATLQYKDGTSFQLKGDLAATTSGTPIGLLFDSVPAGGEFRILFGVYSANGWLAGFWQSDWIVAQPTQGSTLPLGDKNITEVLVPLAGDTQYVFKERIVNQDGTFVWQAGAPPTATLASLVCGNAGTLCELVDITLNNSAFQVGYAWRSSGQNLPPDTADAPPSNAQLYAMQNLSVLAEPGSRLITSDIGLSNKPGIAYAPSTNSPKDIDQTNFILDPRGSVMNLRQVTLNGPKTFDLGAPDLPSWGQFPLANLDALAVHPSNLMLAASWQDSKLMLLPLPAEGCPDSQAPMALMVSGEGIRQGLVRGPKAMAAAPDGRILVLESQNKRVQAFDTKGNPVPSFTPGPSMLSLATASVAAELDQAELAPALADALIARGVGLLFFLDSGFVEQLDTATFETQNDPLIAALSQNGVILAYDPARMNDPALSAQISVVTAGQRWTLSDPRGFTWQIVLQDGTLNVFHRLDKVQVQVITPGQEWLVIDQNTQDAWKLQPSTAQPGQSLVYTALSFFPLKSMRVGNFEFLDMAVEARGYVYVLSCSANGSEPSNYVLDVYAPDGSFCFRSPDPSKTSTPQNLVAGKLTVDIWRNIYGLTYETLVAPSGAPQPGVGHWVPTPPLFSLDVSAQVELNQQNIGAITRDFAAHGVSLSTQAFILVTDPEGAWQLKDGATIYHIYRVGSGIQVYAVPA